MVRVVSTNQLGLGIFGTRVSMEVIVTIVSKLGYSLLTGRIQPTFIRVISYNPFTKYHGHPSNNLSSDPGPSKK